MKRDYKKIDERFENALKSIARYIEEIQEQGRIQERINNLNVSPLQQRINKIRKIADEAKDRIDRIESGEPWYKRIGTGGFASSAIHAGVQLGPFQKQWERNMHELRKADLAEYEYQEKIWPEFEATKYVMETEKDGERIIHELITDSTEEEE